MTYNDKNPIGALNAYVWKLLQVNLGWTSADYNNTVPIIPSAQQPEFMDMGKPFLVYGSAIQTAGHLYALTTESVSYTVYAGTASETAKISNLLNEAFSGQDDSAGYVNTFLDAERAGSGISFKTIRVTMIQKFDPPETEGGYWSGLTMLQTAYTVENNTAQLTF